MAGPQTNFWDQMQAQSQAIEEPQGPVAVPESFEEAKQMGMSPQEYVQVKASFNKGSLVPTNPTQQMQDLSKTYDLKQRQLVNQQGSGIRQLEQMISDYQNMPQEYDPRHLAAFADIFDPSQNWSGRAVAPTGARQKRAAELIGLQEQLQQRKEALTKSQAEGLKAQIDAYKAMKDNTLDNELKKAKIEGLRALTGTRTEGKILPETAVSKVSDFDNSMSELGIVEQNIRNNPQVFGPVKGTIGGLNKYDDRAQAVQADLDTAKQLIGKAVEGGVLRKEDEEKYKKMLPTLQDTPETAAYKMTQFKTRIMQARANYVKNLGKAGYNSKQLNQTSGLTPEQEARRQELLLKMITGE